jgi:hypothetical protein
MLKGQIKRLVNRYGLWPVVNTSLIVVITVQVCIFVLELVIPVRFSGEDFKASSNANVITSRDLSEVLQPEKSNFQELLKVFRPKLFEAATGLQDRPMADKTIERIKSQLKLQCIMEMNGAPVAYVSISGMGLKKCSVGDSIGDLFTVLNINKDSIEVTIVDHKVTLHL